MQLSGHISLDGSGIINVKDADSEFGKYNTKIKIENIYTHTTNSTLISYNYLSIYSNYIEKCQNYAYINNIYFNTSLSKNKQNYNKILIHKF